MTQDAQRIAIAKACGWTEIERINVCDFGGLRGVAPDGIRKIIPSYTTDLNAMHEAVMSLPSGLRDNTFVSALAMVCGFQAHGEHAWDTLHVGRCAVINATAAQRAEAYLKTLNLYKD